MLNPQNKLLRHPERIAEWLRTGRTRPILIEVDPTGYCNATCDWCFYNGQKTGVNINSKHLLKAIKKMKPLAVNWTGGGEPTLHPHFNYMTQEVAKMGIEQGLFTNCLKDMGVNPKLFKWIRVSLTNTYFKGMDTDLLRYYADQTKTGVVLNLTPENAMYADLMCRQARDLGVAYFQVRPALNRRGVTNIEIPDLKHLETDNFRVFLTEYKFDDAQRPHSYDKCYGYHFCPVIDYNGDVRACNYHFDRYAFGNISDMKLTIPDHVAVCDDCQVCCKNHEINKVLFALSQEQEDENFI